MNIACAFGDFNHIGDKHIIPPRIIFFHKAVNMLRQLTCLCDMFLDGVGLHIDAVDVKQVLRRFHFKDRIHQLTRYGFARGQRKKLRLIFFDIMLQNRARGGELRIQQRRGFLVCAKQDKHTVTALRVEVKLIAKLMPDFWRVARNINMKLGQRRGLIRQML